MSLMLLFVNFLSGQNINEIADASYSDMLSDVDIEASYGPMNSANSLSVYPHIIKKAQVFVLHFDHKIKGSYKVDLVDASGNHIETVYNSQLSVFDAKSSLSLEVYTPLETGMYYVVLSTKDFSQATKLMKF